MAGDIFGFDGRHFQVWRATFRVLPRPQQRVRPSHIPQITLPSCACTTQKTQAVSREFDVRIRWSDYKSLESISSLAHISPLVAHMLNIVLLRLSCACHAQNCPPPGMLRTHFNLKNWRRPFWKRQGQNSRSLGTAVLLQPPERNFNSKAKIETKSETKNLKNALKRPRKMLSRIQLPESFSPAPFHSFAPAISNTTSNTISSFFSRRESAGVSTRESFSAGYPADPGHPGDIRADVLDVHVLRGSQKHF